MLEAGTRGQSTDRPLLQGSLALGKEAEVLRKEEPDYMRADSEIHF